MSIKYSTSSNLGDNFKQFSQCTITIMQMSSVYTKIVQQIYFSVALLIDCLYIVHYIITIIHYVLFDDNTVRESYSSYLKIQYKVRLIIYKDQYLFMFILQVIIFGNFYILSMLYPEIIIFW